MRRKPSHSVRSVAFATAFCALGIAAGCGRAEFNLLPNESSSNAGRSSSGGSFGGNIGLGGNPGSSGRTGNGGGAGKGEFGGFGGHFVFPTGGSGPTGGWGNAPCLGEAGCPDEPITCVPGDPFCMNCARSKDCPLKIADECDLELKRCVQCRWDSECNAPGSSEYRCNTKTYRCAKSCGPGKDGCGADPQHSICNQELGICVSCLKNDDCNGYGPGAQCYLNECVQCSQNTQCPSQQCVFGYCVQH